MYAEIIFNTDGRMATTYLATYLHQQLRGNEDYISNNIILNMDNDHKVVLLFFHGLDFTNLPKLAIDFSGVKSTVIKTNGDTNFISRIADSIGSQFDDYGSEVVENTVIGRNYNNGTVTIENPDQIHAVFDFKEWFKDYIRKIW